jgi:hypothetical protein
LCHQKLKEASLSDCGTAVVDLRGIGPLSCRRVREAAGKSVRDFAARNFLARLFHPPFCMREKTNFVSGFKSIRRVSFAVRNI